MLPLAYPRMWISAGVLLVVIVMSGSLVPGDYVHGAMDWNDKVTHALTYTGLTLWFTGIFPRSRYAWVVLAIFAFGALIEILQAVMPFGRHGDFADLIANSSGILLGLMLAIFWLEGWPQWVEARLRQAAGS
jgi:VanZ family protein